MKKKTNVVSTQNTFATTKRPDVISWALANKSPDLDKAFSDFLGVFPTMAGAASRFTSHNDLPSQGTRILNCATYWVELDDGAVAVWAERNKVDPQSPPFWSESK